MESLNRVEVNPPPSGTVTIVFTDIESSTKQWDKNPVGFSKSLKMHNQLLRKKLKELGGYEVKSAGDGFIVAFNNVNDACLWCLHVQQELLVVNWPLELLNSLDGEEIRDSGIVTFRGLRVRMGINSGEPTCEIDQSTKRMDYFGTVVNMTARVCDASFGGQILCTKAIFQQATEIVKSNGSFRCLGPQDLKGFEKKETLYQLISHKLAARKFPVNVRNRKAFDDLNASSFFRERLKQLKSSNEELLKQQRLIRQHSSELNQIMKSLSIPCYFRLNIEK